MKKPFSALLFSLLFYALGNSAQAGVFNAVETVLENGLRVVVLENQRAPVVTQILFYKVGGMDDPPGKSGLAHVLEHMMFKGTPTFPEGDFSSAVARVGGQHNAFTSQDVTAYYQTMPADQLETVMAMEADRMRNLYFSDATFKDSFPVEVQVVIEERSQRTENNPSARLSEQANPAFYLNHPYRRPIIGWPEEIEALTLDDLQAFYDRFYQPENAVLVIAGDVTSKKAFKLAEEYYGKISAGPASLTGQPIHTHYGAAPLAVASTVTLADPLVRVPQWRLYLPALSVMDGVMDDIGDREKTYDTIAALSILSEALAGGASSRLYRQLVIEQKVAVEAGGWLDVIRRGPGRIGFYAVPRADTVEEPQIDKLRTAFMDILEDFARTGPTEQEVEAAKRRTRDAADLNLDSLMGPARQLGQSLILDIPLAVVEDWPARIDSIPAADLQELARDFLRSPGRVEAVLLPQTSEISLIDQW